MMNLEDNESSSILEKGREAERVPLNRAKNWLICYKRWYYNT